MSAKNAIFRKDADRYPGCCRLLVHSGFILKSSCNQLNYWNFQYLSNLPCLAAEYRKYSRKWYQTKTKLLAEIIFWNRCVETKYENWKNQLPYPLFSESPVQSLATKVHFILWCYEIEFYITNQTVCLHDDTCCTISNWRVPVQHVCRLFRAPLCKFSFNMKWARWLEWFYSNIGQLLTSFSAKNTDHHSRQLLKYNWG